MTDEKSSPSQPRLFSKFDTADWIALAGAFLTFLFWIELLVYKYYSLGYYDWDLALYSQAMWNLVRGSFTPSLFHINFLANHAEYITFLLIPIYAVFQHPLTLIFLKIFSFVLGGWILYLIARKSLPSAWAILFMFLYFIFPANIYALLYEFHFESLGIGAIFLLFYFFRERKVIPFYITMVFLALIKENMPPIIAAFGLYSLCVRSRNKLVWGVVPILFGAAVFYIAMFLITPALREGLGSSNQYLGLYHSLGATPLEILKNFILHPQKLFAILLKPYNVHFLDSLTRPLMFLPLFSPHILFLGSPLFLQHMLSSSGQEHTILYHYAATLSPFIFLAALESLRFIRRHLRAGYFSIVCVMVFISSLVNLGYYRADLVDRISKFNDSLTLVRWQMIDEIPKDKGVIATFRFSSPLSQRKSLYSYLNVLEGWLGLSFQKSDFPPDDVEYALLDLEDLWIAERVINASDTVIPKISSFFDKGWRLKDAMADVVLLQRDPNSSFHLVQRFNEPRLPRNAQAIVIDKSFQFLGHEWGPKLIQRPNTLSFIFYWRPLEDMNKMYKMDIRIKHNDKIIHNDVRRIGYTIAPTNSWEKGQYIKEYYWFPLPGLTSGTYSIEVVFINSTDMKVAAIKKLDAAQTEEEHNLLTLGTFLVP